MTCLSFALHLPLIQIGSKGGLDQNTRGTKLVELPVPHVDQTKMVGQVGQLWK